VTWVAYDSYGAPLEDAMVNILASVYSERGVVEVQCRPYVWERLCAIYGSTRPVTTTVVEDRASFTTCASARVVRFYGTEELGSNDFRVRVVPR
jgi:hypothetical protein